MLLLPCLSNSLCRPGDAAPQVDSQQTSSSNKKSMPEPACHLLPSQGPSPRPPAAQPSLAAAAQEQCWCLRASRLHRMRLATQQQTPPLPLLKTLEGSAKQQIWQLSQGSNNVCDSMPHPCQTQVHIGLSGPHWQRPNSPAGSCCTWRHFTAAPTAAQQHAERAEV